MNELADQGNTHIHVCNAIANRQLEHMDDNAVDEAWSVTELGPGNNTVGV
jgi:hypothetical protein